MINTLLYTKKPEAAGISREQAEAHIQMIAEIVEGDLATKTDIHNLRTATGSDILNLRVATETDIHNLKSELKNDIAELKNGMKVLEHKLVIKLSAIMGAMVTLAIAIVSVITKFH